MLEFFRLMIFFYVLAPSGSNSSEILNCQPRQIPGQAPEREGGKGYRSHNAWCHEKAKTAPCVSRSGTETEFGHSRVCVKKETEN